MRSRIPALVLTTLLAATTFCVPGLAATISGPSSSTTGTFTLTWTTGYSLADASGIIEGPPATSHGFTDLPIGRYTFHLVSAWEYWDESGQHAVYLMDPGSEKVVTVEPDALPPPPPAAIFGPKTDTDGAYAIDWGTSAGADSYVLQEQSNEGAWSTIQADPATSRAFSGKGDGTWAYRVQACNAGACSAWTATHTVQVLSSPGVPGAITSPATDADGSFIVTWTAASGTVSRYELDERAGGGSFARIQSDVALDRSVVGKINNVYQYRVRACNALSCGGYTATESVHVTDNPGDADLPNAAPAPAVVSIPSASVASDAVGVVAGTFRVDASGAATYSIPIATAPGSGGVAPVLSLDYSSHAGNGIAGVGWRLTGTSVIARCRSTRETDNTAMGAVRFAPTDRFCLDRARLVLVSGTYGGHGAEYRTEIDSFAKVVSYGSQGGGPSYFKVWRKDGSVSEYGNTADSRIEAFGADSAVYVWAQNRFSDSATNTIDFEYVEDATDGIEFVLDRIHYTGNANAGTRPYAELRFIYDTDRSDKTRGYLAGMVSRQTKRLTDIESWVGSTLIHRYRLDYEAAPSSRSSRLASVTLCGSTVCLEPTSFSWQDAGGGFEAAASNDYYTRYFKGGKPADVDGDGDSDLVWLRANNLGEPKIEIMRSEDGQLRSQGQVVGANSAEAASWQILDYNNDGKHDLLLAEGNYWQVRLGGTDAYGNPTFGPPINTGLAPDGYNRAAVGDFDGNGLADFLYAQNGSLYLRPLLKNGSTYAFGSAQAMTLECAPGECESYLPSTIAPDSLRPVVADFNGDGLIDLFLRVTVDSWCESELGPCPAASSYWRVYVRNPAAASFRYYDTISIDTATTDPKVTLGDVNGDGLTDIAYADGASSVWRYRISTGKALAPAVTIASLASTDERTAFADVDGDGRQDFLYTTAGTWYVRRAVESGLADSGTTTGLPAKVGSYAQSGWVGYFHDINGDGRSDYSRYFLGDNTSLTRTYVRLGADPFVPANVITRISNGFGATTEIEYQAFTDPNRTADYYAKSTNGRSATWGNDTPVIDLLTPLYAVKRVHSSAPSAGPVAGQVDNGATSAVSYRYAGAKLQGGGRGFLGYASMTTIDEQTGLETTTSYLQNFPYVGLPASTIVKTARGETLSSTTSIWLDRTAGNGPFRQPYLSRSVMHSCDLATAQSTCAAGIGALLSAVTTTTTVDDYGNATTVNVITSGGAITVGKLTTNSYADDVANWKLGRLIETEVVHSRTGQPDVTRKARFRYATGSKFLDQEVVEPDGPPGESLTTTYTLDAFGNRRVVTTRGWDGTSIVERTTALTFDASGRHPDWTHNTYNHPVQHVTQRNDRGQPIRIDDALGNETRIGYGDLGREYFRGDDTGHFTHSEQALCSELDDCPDAAHYRIRTTIAGGGRTDVFHDLLGREVRSASAGFDGTPIFVDTEYDPLGRVARKSEPYFANATSDWTEVSYDILGRIIAVRHPDYPRSGNETTLDHAGFVTTITNSRNQHRIETRSPFGELIKVEDHLGNGVDYTYDAAGKLTTATQFGTDTGTTAVTALAHDRLGRKIAMVDANMGAWGYAYNAFGELIQQNTAIPGKYTRVRYDLLGRMVSRVDYSGGAEEADAAWLYDACSHGLGKLCQEDTIPGAPPAPASLTRAFGYDRFGRAASVTTTINGEVYTASTTYDPQGRVFQHFDGAEAHSGLEYQYNAHGYRDVAIEARGSASATLERYRIEAMDARGNVTQLSKGGLTVRKTFAPDTGRIQAIESLGPALNAIQDLSFSFDVLGNLTEKADLRRGLSEAYSYDGLNRLIGVAGPSTMTMTYDGLGNITSKSDVGHYGYGSKPHAVASAGSTTYAYDDNGNLTSSSVGHRNAYTVFNKPYGMTMPGNSVTIDYGPNRERYRRIDVQSGRATTVHYIGSIEKIWHPGGAVEIKRHLDGEAIEAINGTNRSTQYLLTDHLGSLDAIADANATIVQSMAFDAFGGRRQARDYAALDPAALQTFDVSHTSKGFTFHEHLDPVALIHMNGRVYDPKLARFLSADPFVQAPSYSQSSNRYSYGFNNPLNGTDPSGYAFDPTGFVVDTIVNSLIRIVSDHVSGRPPHAVTQPGVVASAFDTGSASILTTGACAPRDKCLNVTGEDAFGDTVVDRSLGGTRSEETAGNFENGAGSQAFGLLVLPARVRTRVPGTQPFLATLRDGRGRPVTILRGDSPSLTTWFDVESVLSWTLQEPAKQLLVSLTWELANELRIDQLVDHPRFFSVDVGTQRVRELQLYERFEDVFDAIYDPADTGRVLSGINRRHESTNLVVTKELNQYDKLVFKICWRGTCGDNFERSDAH